MRIDAHQHFWALARGDYGWLTPDLAPIYRDFQPKDLEPALSARGIGGTVLVQAAPTEAETAYMLDLAAQTGFVKGVVGWVDFESPGAVDSIATLAENPLLLGLRPMIHDIVDDAWMLGPALTPAFDAMAASGLVFDALTRPRHLGHLSTLLGRHPDLTVVIDHGSKPNIAAGHFDAWADAMARLARETGAAVKLSGLVTEAGPDWRVETLRPYVDHLLDTFGPDRMLWGSDWPVCTLASDYARWCAATDALIGALSDREKAAILGGTAIATYGLAAPA